MRLQRSLFQVNGMNLTVATSGLFRPLGFVSLLAIASLACAFLSFGNSDAGPTPDAPPSSEVLSYLVPLYSVTLEPGKNVPMTQMAYVGREGDQYNVTIDGLSAVKRIGDSFIWRGIIAPGVVATYRLRISPTFLSDNLLVGGPVELAVLNPVPVELPNVAVANSAPIHFTNVPVDITVAKGEQLPGTTLVYEGEADQGAELSGTNGYPYRARGDSLIWSGRLRGNVVVRHSLRVVDVSDGSLRLIGTAELWITSA